jgi:hypothetical protein
MKFKGWRTKGKLHTYDVRINCDWMGDAVARVYVVAPRRWFPGLHWKHVYTSYDGRGCPRDPAGFKRVAEAAVFNYEHWKLAWEKHENEQTWNETVERNIK